MGTSVSLALSRDGRYFATAAGKCDIELWDAQTGSHITTLEDTDRIHSLDFLPDGRLASGNKVGEVSLWDIVTNSRVPLVNAHSDKIVSLSATQSKLASGSEGKAVRVWDTTSWDRTSTFECDDVVESVALYTNDNRVAACTLDTLYVWDTVTQKLITSKNISECRGLAVSNDGKWLAVASIESISLYDASTLDRIWSHDRDSEFISFSPDSCQLVSANLNDGKVELIDVPNGNLVKSFNHVNVSRAVFSHDGTRVVSGGSRFVAPRIVLISSIYQFP